MAEEMMINTAPIPGQSLTKPPGNAPYERPPEITDPEQALMGYINYLNDPKVLQGIMGLLETGFDLTTLVEGLLRGGVAEGYHSIDTSLVITKPLISFLVKIADATGIDYKVGNPELDGEEEDLSQFEDLSLDELDLDVSGQSIDQVMSEEPLEEQPLEEESVQEEPMVEEEGPPKKGLMERGQ